MRNKEHWHRHGPPWRDREEWEEWKSQRHGQPPPWMKHRRASEWHHSDRGLFFRFSLIFGLFVLLGCGALAALGAVAMLFFQQQGIPLPTPVPDHRWEAFRWVLGFLALALVLAMALRRVGTIAVRRITSPLSETMKAADAMAEGDLSVRVPEEGNGEFRHFARSFNRMAEALETADRQRRELLADVAHELRTPLTIIQGNLEGLRDGIYEATPEHLELVLDETRNLGRLVDDLRLLTLAEAGQLPLDLQLLGVSQLLADVRDAFACQARETGIALTMEVAELLPPLIGDPQRLGQVLGNLVANALRHTLAGGEIALGAALASSQDGHNWLRLWIADTGEGIPSEDLPRIFDRFWRGDPSRSHAAGGGSGLGLAIAKSLVEAHGGRIGAKSQLGEGTTVYCLFPLPNAGTD